MELTVYWTRFAEDKLDDILSTRPQNFRYLVFKNYKIIYWINQNKNRVDIVNIFDTRQSPLKMKTLEE